MALALGLLWMAFGAVDRGEDVVERELQAEAEVVASPEPDETIIRAQRRTPRREERPVISEPPDEQMAQAGFVVCPIEDVPVGTAGFFMIPGGRGSRVAVSELGVSLRVPAGVSAGRLVLDGYGAMDVQFSFGDGTTHGNCGGPIRYEQGPAVVSGMVTHADGRPAGKVWVQGCGRRVLTDVDGSYYLEALVEGSCAVQAFRKDGVFTIWSPDVTVQPIGGEDVVADLELPPYTTAGLGAEVRNVDDGILILRTLEGSAAQLAGLRKGDLVLEIDGVPTVELSLQEFVGRALGPSGTDVELVVAEGDSERVVELQRQIVERDDG